MRIRAILWVLIFLAASIPRILWAGVSPETAKAVEAAYPPAVEHYGIQSAQDDLDMTKLRGFAVVEKGGIPAEPARYFISWQDYDYRGVVIHLGEGDKLTTRRGEIYAYLQRGDVMAVAGIKIFNDTIYLKLISPEVYVPEERSADKHHSRVTVMAGFKFTKGMLEQGPDAVLKIMKEWFRPFPNMDDAKAYSQGIQDQLKAASAAASTPAPEGGKASSGAVPAATAVVPDAKASSGDQRVKTLEEKIDDAKRQLDEAEKELNQIKGSKKK